MPNTEDTKTPQHELREHLDTLMTAAEMQGCSVRDRLAELTLAAEMIKMNMIVGRIKGWQAAQQSAAEPLIVKP